MWLTGRLLLLLTIERGVSSFWHFRHKQFTLKCFLLCVALWRPFKIQQYFTCPDRSSSWLDENLNVSTWTTDVFRRWILWHIRPVPGLCSGCCCLRAAAGESWKRGDRFFWHQSSETLKKTSFIFVSLSWHEQPLDTETRNKTLAMSLLRRSIDVYLIQLQILASFFLQ